MSQKPLLSVILSFRNNRDAIEPTLASLFELQSVPFELFIVDDASTDGSNDAIQSLLDYYEHEQVYYFEHAEPAGRANCINEILPQCNGRMVWVPTSLEQLNERALEECLQSLRESEAAGCLQDFKLPESPEDWLDLINRDDWPADGSFIWDLARIPKHQQFFNPYLQRHHGLELLLRLSGTHSFEKTDAFSTVSSFEEAPEISLPDRVELLYAMLRIPGLEKERRIAVMDRIRQVISESPVPKAGGFENESLEKAFSLKNEGRFNEALQHVEKVLKEEPNHRRARELKIEILEKKQRFVQASELKHEFDGKKSSGPDTIKVSIIIPTAMHSKPVLEHCLISLSEHCDRTTTELIVIDNASLDDTHDYLAELEKKGFLNCRVITNKENKGFAASVNQGLDACKGDYACIMHNDVEVTDKTIGKLRELMEEHKEYALIGPLATKTLNPDQSLRYRDDYKKELMQSEYLDSFCMMLRTNTGLRMDEAYELAFFEDIDLCFEARKKGYKVGIATQLDVTHHYGTTTFALNLDTESEQYWKNVAYFNKKWGVEVYSEAELKSKSTFDQLLALDELVNPLFPEKPIKDYFEKLFTDELKTELLRSEHDPETLCRLVHLMMVMDQREVMRRLEDRLENIELPASLIYQMVRFYFKRNIFSRCRHYLKKLKAEQQSLQSELYKLEMLINEKEMEDAIPKLKELLDDAPSNPTLYKLAGDIHSFDGNEEEAESFYRIARQINPFKFSEEDEEQKGSLEITEEDLEKLG